MIFIKRLFLSYETIWYLDGEERRSITIKRAVEQTTREENLDNKDTQRDAIKIDRYCSFNAYDDSYKTFKTEVKVTFILPRSSCLLSRLCPQFKIWFIAYISIQKKEKVF